MSLKPPTTPTSTLQSTGLLAPNGWFDVTDTAYGADNTGVLDSTTAIQSAITAAAAVSHGVSRGATVYFPPGIYKCATGLDVSQTYNLTLLGGGSVLSGSGAYGGASVISYTGTASRFLDARSSYGLTLEDLCIQYTSGSFTGILVDFQHDSVVSDSYGMVIRHCVLTGRSVLSAQCLVSLKQAILATIEGGTFGYAQAGIRCREDNGVGGVDYSNAHKICGVTFEHLTTAAIMNAGETLEVDGCWFEGTGSDGLARAYYDDLTVAGQFTYGLKFTGCWMGDATAVTNWIQGGANVSYQGFELDSCFFSGGTKCVLFAKGGRGLKVSGNHFSGTNAIDLGASATGLWGGVEVSGNDFGSVTGTPVANSSGHRGVVVEGNSARNGENHPETLITVDGYITTARPRGLATSIAVVVAQAGTGASASIVGNDTAGTITINMGSAATGAGVLANITYGQAYDSATAASADGHSSTRGKVFLQARNDNASALNTSTQGGTNTGWSIYGRTAPTINQTYIWDYFSIQ